MACSSERSDQLAQLAAGQLDASQFDALLEHVEGCASCSNELDTVALVVAGESTSTASGATALRALPATARRGNSLRWLLAVAAALALVFLVREALVPRSASSIAELASIEPVALIESTLRGGAIGTAAEAEDAWARGQAHYRALEFGAASAAFEQAFANGDRRALVQLYLGVALLQTGDLDRAALALASAERDGAGLVAQRAAWYRVNLHLLQGDAVAARTRLVAIVAGGGDYQINAQQLLERLDEHSD